MEPTDQPELLATDEPDPFTEEVRAALLRLLSDPSPELRAALAEAVRGVGRSDVPATRLSVEAADMGTIKAR